MNHSEKPTVTRIQSHEACRYAITDSTNARLKAMAREGAAHGTVVIADAQTHGRGRFDRKWLSRPGGGAWFSVLVRPENVPAESASDLVLLAALGMAEALNSFAPGAVTVKWPNDLIAGKRKIAGILSEMSALDGRLQWAVLGIGVNLAPTRFPDDLPWAGSFENETGIALSAPDCVSAFLPRFDRLYGEWLKSGLSPALSRISEISATIGKRVRISDGSGRVYEADAVAFAPDGALVVNENGIEKTLRAGDVSVRGIMDYA